MKKFKGLKRVNALALCDIMCLGIIFLSGCSDDDNKVDDMLGEYRDRQDDLTSKDGSEEDYKTSVQYCSESTDVF